jgi:hypothetical protein
LLFAWVLVEQFGIPLPATPVLLAAGALSAEHQLNFSSGVFGFPFRVADRRFFLVPDRPQVRPSCAASALQAVDGADHLCTPHHGLVWPPPPRHSDDRQVRPWIGDPGTARSRPERHGIRQFLLFDGIGATLWLGLLLALGRFFGDLLKRDPSLLNWAGRFSGALLVLGIIGFFLVRSYAAAWSSRN